MTDGTNKYVEVSETLREEILGGKYSLATAFPSEMALAKRFGTARATIRRALGLLRNEGLVGSRQGAGTFVTRAAKSRKIAFVVPSVSRFELFPPILSTLNRLARDAGYTLLFRDGYSADPAVRREEVRRLAAELVREGVSGVIYQPLDYSSDEGELNRTVLSAFDRAKISVVLLDSDIVPMPARSGYDLVCIDNEQAGAVLARHLLDCGAKRIGFVSRTTWWPNEMARLRGVQFAVMAQGRRWTPDNVLFVDSEALMAGQRLPERLRFDAFVCADDALAAELKTAIGRAGREVPKDVMLAGFDDVKIARLMTPSLTTMRQPCEALAAAAFGRLLERIACPHLLPVKILLPAVLVKRESTR